MGMACSTVRCRRFYHCLSDWKKNVATGVPMNGKKSPWKLKLLAVRYNQVSLYRAGSVLRQRTERNGNTLVVYLAALGSPPSVACLVYLQRALLHMGLTMRWFHCCMGHFRVAWRIRFDSYNKHLSSPQHAPSPILESLVNHGWTPTMVHYSCFLVLFPH